MMSKTFKTIKEYEDYINIKLRTAMREVGKECKQELMDAIEHNLYTMYPNSDYQKTYQFLHAVDFNTTVVNGVVTVECFVNPDKITKLGIDKNSGWGIHQDIYGNDVRENLVLWLEEGTDYPSMFPREGAYFIKETREFMEKNYRFLLIKKLRARGIPVQ